VTIHTDSKYVQLGATKWIHGWKRKDWHTAAGQPVKNRDLWQSLDALQQTRHVSWSWVKGHSGHPLNDLADQLARQGVAAGGPDVDEEEASVD
jgi:ribonuclease HI